jgi:hypothetical protein
MTYSNMYFRRHSGAFALSAISLILAGLVVALVAGSVAGCSPDTKDSPLPSKNMDAQGAAKAEPALRDGALPGGGGLAGDRGQLAGSAGHLAQGSIGGARGLKATVPVADGVTLQPFGLVPGPGQVQWPGEKTPAPAVASTRSPFQ